MMHARILAISTIAIACVLVGCGLDVVRNVDDEPLSSSKRVGDTPTKTDEPVEASEETPPPGSTTLPPDVPVEPVPSPNASEPATALSPFHPSGMLTYQRPIVWTIGAFDPTTTIHYTTDGSTPTTRSAGVGTGKVAIDNLPEGAHIQWIAGMSDVVHSFTVHVDENLASATHHIVENVRFNGSGGPILRVKPGALVSGKAGAAVWNGTTTCPTCIDQITIGFTLAATCLVSVQPNTFPGHDTDHSFSLTAPMTPGVYKLKTGFEQQYKCSDAIGRGLHDTEIGTVIVEP